MSPSLLMELCVRDDGDDAPVAGARPGSPTSVGSRLGSAAAAEEASVDQPRVRRVASDGGRSGAAEEAVEGGRMWTRVSKDPASQHGASAPARARAQGP